LRVPRRRVKAAREKENKKREPCLGRREPHRKKKRKGRGSGEW